MFSPRNLLLFRLFADLEKLIEKIKVVFFFFFVRRLKVFQERQRVCFLICLIMKNQMKNLIFLFFTPTGGHISRSPVNKKSLGFVAKSLPAFLSTWPEKTAPLTSLLTTRGERCH